MVPLWVSYSVTAYHNKELGNHGTCCFILGFVISMTLDIYEKFISSTKISAPKYLLKSFLRFSTEEFSQNSFMIYKTFYIYYLHILKGIKKMQIPSNGDWVKEVGLKIQFILNECKVVYNNLLIPFAFLQFPFHFTLIHHLYKWRVAILSLQYLSYEWRSFFFFPN